MKFVTFLNKHFDTVIEMDKLNDFSIITGDLKNERGMTECISVYEKGQDCEPVLILYKSINNGYWIVGDIYSQLTHNKEYSEQEIKELTVKGLVITIFE